MIATEPNQQPPGQLLCGILRSKVLHDVVPNHGQLAAAHRQYAVVKQPTHLAEVSSTALPFGSSTLRACLHNPAVTVPTSAVEPVTMTAASATVSELALTGAGFYSACGRHLMATPAATRPRSAAAASSVLRPTNQAHFARFDRR